MIFRERGYFWNAEIQLPETSFAPDSAIYGLLEVDDDGSIRLELDGLINGPRSIYWSNKKRNETVLIAGKLKADASYVLLIDALNNGQTYSTHNISHEKYVALYCLRAGCEVERLKDLASSIQTSKTYCSSYNELFDVSPIKFTRENGDVHVKYSPAPPLLVEMDGRSFKIDHDAAMPFGDERSLSSLHIECVSTVSIKFDEIMSVEEVAHEHRMLHDLLVLLSNIRSDIDWPRVNSISGDVYATLYYLSGKPATEPFERHNCWTTIQQVRSDIPSIVARWFAKRRIIGSGIYLYLSTRRGVEMYSEQRFMTLMWGLEAFHRAVSEPPSDDRVRAKIDRILDAVEPRDRRWLASRLRGPLEPSLDVRIYELLRILPLGFRSEELRNFSETCRTIRNNISHFGEASRDRHVVDVQKLSDLFRAMSYLYHARILFEIGVGDDHIRWIFSRSFRSSIIRDTLKSVGISMNIDNAIANKSITDVTRNEGPE